VLNNKEAASFLGVSEERLRDLIDRKLIPSYLIGGTFTRFKEEELKALKEMLGSSAGHDAQRVFHQSFRKVKGLQRLGEIIRANDIYLLVGAALIILLIFLVRSRV